MKLDLAELRRLHEAATPGPWDERGDENDRESSSYVVSEAYVDEEPGICGDCNKHWPLVRADAELIVAARNALPALLARAEVYEAAVAWWKEHRPIGYTDAKHRKNPGINCVGEIERALAASIAKVEEVENG